MSEFTVSKMESKLTKGQTLSPLLENKGPGDEFHR